MGECGSANYSLKDNGIVRVINSQRFKNWPGRIGGESAGLTPNAAQGFASGVLPVPKDTKPQISDSDKIKMGIFSNPIKNGKNMNLEYMMDERFGNIRWKYNDESGRTYSYSQSEGMARKLDPQANDGRFQLKFSKFQPMWENYHVLETDYESYSIIYSCRTLLFGKVKNEYAWIVTREPLDPLANTKEFNKITQRAKEVFKENVSDFDFDKMMQRTIQGEQNDCIYAMPVPQ